LIELTKLFLIPSDEKKKKNTVTPVTNRFMLTYQYPCHYTCNQFQR